MQETQNNMTSDQYDVVVIGGGPVGMALSLALQGSGVSSLLLEARGIPEKVDDPRPLALSYGSHLILRRLGAWSLLSQHTPITTIHISNRGNFGKTTITPQDAGVPTLGFVVNYHDLFHAMHKNLTVSDTHYLPGAAVNKLETFDDSGTVYFSHQNDEKKVSAKLLVLADGGQLAKQLPEIQYHTYDYQQWAVVANVQADKKQTGIAYERFTSDGPVALLPNQQDFALVWTVAPEIAEEIIQLNDKNFLSHLQQHFGGRLGKLIGASKRSAFPLTLKYANPVITHRVALVGNAAQTLHPVAGQGFNLGLRDAYELANEIIRSYAQGSEIGTSVMLSRYRQKRGMDSSAGRVFTDSLVKLFSNKHILLQQASGFGLSTLDCLPPLKRFVSRRMIFGARG